MEHVSAQMAGMADTALWRDVLATVMDMAPAVCLTTSRAGSVCVRVAGTVLAVTLGWSRIVMTSKTMTRVSDRVFYDNKETSASMIHFQMDLLIVKTPSAVSHLLVNTLNCAIQSRLL